ncbi:MAG: hypothetical protein ACJ8IR_01095 [Alphaproteobacteria bacterium]|jgi:hypothetical protein
MTMLGRISAVAELIAYTFRYLRADGAFARVLSCKCDGDAEALRRAAAYMDKDSAALEVSCGPRLIWHGLREEALAAKG